MSTCGSAIQYATATRTKISPATRRSLRPSGLIARVPSCTRNRLTRSRPPTLNPHLLADQPPNVHTALRRRDAQTRRPECQQMPPIPTMRPHPCPLRLRTAARPRGSGATVPTRPSTAARDTVEERCETWQRLGSSSDMAPAGERDGGGPQVGLARLSRLLSPRQREAPPSGAGRRRSVSWSVVGVLAALVVVSGVVHVWALHRDLPLHDADESAFVGPAVHVAATGDLNPHWFGHPGSTVIYPLAGLFHVWDVVFHHGPIFSPNSALSFRLHRYPTEFYSIGRLWT